VPFEFLIFLFGPEGAAKGQTKKFAAGNTVFTNQKCRGDSMDTERCEYKRMGIELISDELKATMPGLYSQENEPDPIVRVLCSPEHNACYAAAKVMSSCSAGPRTRKANAVKVLKFGF
jgi:hypothetical protein